MPDHSHSRQPVPPGSARLRERLRFALLLLLLCIGATSQAGIAVPAGEASAAGADLPRTPAQWLDHYRDLSRQAPAHCAPVAFPRLPSATPAKAFAQTQFPGSTAETSLVVFSRDPLTERLIVLAQGADGCIHANVSGTLVPVAERAVTSPLPNSRIPGALGDTPPVAIVADSKSIRPWIGVVSEDEFLEMAARSWLWVGSYTGIITVLIILGLGFAVSRRSSLALAYVLFVCALQFYQLQSFGLGAAWLPFWPGPEYARIMQALGPALLMPALAAVILGFLSPRGLPRYLIVVGVGLGMAGFLSAVWTDAGYRLGAGITTLLAMLAFALLMSRLRRSDDSAVRWLAAGLLASMIGGGIQAASVALGGAGLPPISARALPIGNLIESVCWLIALSLRFRSEHRDIQRKLIRSAASDGLTGTFNRGHLYSLLTDALRYAKQHGTRRIGLLLIDLDDFRQLSGTLGHTRGDKVLIAAARALEDLKLDCEGIGRFGGDRYMILIGRNTHWPSAKGAAAAVVARFKEPIEVEGREERIGASVGLVAITAEYPDADAIIRDAETALMIAKRRGGGRYVPFEPHMRQDAEQRTRMRADLANALKQGELVLHYQPILEMETMRPLGFEAMLRWSHPRQGLLTGSDFLPVAERCGLMPAIGTRVVDLAFAQIRDWQHAGLWQQGLYVRINLSAQQLFDGGLLDQLDRALDRFPVDPGSIRIEIPESALASQEQLWTRVLPRLLGRGILLAADNFGTGLSGIAPLTKFEFDLIKLDPRIVDGVLHRGHSQNMARIAQMLGQELGSLVVAVGIDRVEQFEQLQTMGYKYGQGKLLSPPMPPEDVIAWLELQRREQQYPDIRGTTDKLLH
ncbi:MAG: EAL domain-containing protein [Thiohalocapsa sp.]|nr:EAL domain-containing protein [Thiohalocapsa sp.]